MHELTSKYLAAMDAAEALEQDMIRLAKRQLAMDHQAFQEVFERPYWEYPPQNLRYSVGRESGEIVLTNVCDCNYSFGSFPLQIDHAEADNSAVYASMVRKYAALKEDAAAKRALETEARVSQLRAELAKLEAAGKETGSCRSGSLSLSARAG